jgi:hypothetical protein
METLTNTIKAIFLKVAAVVSSLFSSLDKNNDGKLDEADFDAIKAEVKADFKKLEKKTKADIEAAGKKLGVDLDKRLTKSKMLSQLKDLVK